MLGMCKALHLQSHTETKQNPSWNNEHLKPVLKNNNIMQKKTHILNLWFKECSQTQCAYITNFRPKNWKLSLPPRSPLSISLFIQMFISMMSNQSLILILTDILAVIAFIINEYWTKALYTYHTQTLPLFYALRQNVCLIWVQLNHTFM